MEIGVNLTPLVPTLLPTAARYAEALGFESVWMGEHILTPVQSVSEYGGETETFDADSAFLEPFVALAAMASVTSRVRLGTGVVILPVRDPYLTARAIASVDVLSGGRLDLGVGVGWMEEEFSVLGKDFHARGAVMDEFLHVLDLLFGESRPEFSGRHFSFPKMGFEPKPPGGRRPRTLIGGFAPAALARAVRYDGWYGYVRGPEDARHFCGALAELRAEAGHTGPFDVSAVHLHAPGRDELEELAAAGLDRVVVTPWQQPDGSAVLVGRSRSLDPLEEYASRVGTSV